MDKVLRSRFENAERLNQLAAEAEREVGSVCRELIAAFDSTHQPLKRVETLEIRPATLQAWLAEHKPQEPTA